MRVGSDAAPARVLTHSTHPGGAGAPPGGQYEPPARSWLTDGRSRYGNGQRKAWPGAVRKTPANKPRRRQACLGGAPRGARTLERECGNKEQWLRHLARHPPRFWRGARRREERRAYPGPRSKNTGDDAWLFEK